MRIEYQLPHPPYKNSPKSRKKKVQKNGENVEGYGEATAVDTGEAIKGNRFDVFIPSEQDAINFGVKQLKVTILN